MSLGEPILPGVAVLRVGEAVEFHQDIGHLKIGQVISPKLWKQVRKVFIFNAMDPHL